MATPNLITINSVVGKTRADWCTTTLTNILENALNSSQSLRVNSIFISNVSASEAGVSLDFLRSGLSFYITLNNLIAPGTSMVLMGKDISIYLEEGDALRIRSTSANSLQYVISYEIIS